jgi:F1F0 ATPase subunit 2
MDMTAQGFGFAVLLGLLLGATYMGALWGSVRRLGRSEHPLRDLLAGAALRIGVLTAALLLVMDGRPERLAGAMLGFLLARLVATRLARRDDAGPRPG